MGYLAEVRVAGELQFVTNALVFDTEQSAQSYVADLASRWTLVRDTRVTPTDREPTHSWIPGEGLHDMKTGNTHMPARQISL